MKKVICILAMLVATLALTACNRSTNDVEAAKVVSTKWNVYESQKGYSLNLPKEARFWSCANKNEFEMMPVIVIEGKTDYITTAEYYVMSEDGVCKKVKTDSENIKNSTVGYWTIAVQTANDEKEIEQFIKDQYGEGCKIAEKKTNIDGIVDIELKGTDPDLNLPENQTCFVNYANIIRYDSNSKKILSWKLGQEAVFYTEDWTPFDNEIIESFAFTK